MKNSETMGVREMDAQEMKKIDGGNWLALAFKLVVGVGSAILSGLAMDMIMNPNAVNAVYQDEWDNYYNDKWK